ncbi:MAG: hypothetical protein GX605_11205, partial [Chloroflexi bacterium]|nr:hypothetical protein [Chloroflexota bacterium]
MSKLQVLVLATLAVLAFSVLGAALWLHSQPAPPAAPTVTPWSPPTFPPTWTPVPAAEKTAAIQQQAASATVTAIAQQGASARSRTEAALLQFPPGEIGLRGDAGQVGLTALRAGWVRYGALWLRV